MKKFLNAAVSYFKHLDKALLILCLIVSGFSIFLLYTLNENGVSGQVSSRQWKIQLTASVIGLVSALILSGIDYKQLTRLWWIYAPVSLAAVLLLFTSLGRGVEGADDIGWLNLGVIQFQPSELLKIAFILTFSLHISKVGSRLNEPLNVILLCVHGAIPAFIIIKQGDDGSALVFIFIFATMLFAAGISWKYIIAALLSVPVVLYFVWNYVMHSYQIKRLQLLWDEELQQQEILGLYMQQYLGKKALGSGGLTGLGVFGSDQYTYVPEIDTDFIFSYIGMTLGLLGCIVTVILLAALCLKCLAVAGGAKDSLGRMICAGAFALYFSHSIVNIGMAMGVMPVIGIPLPLISAGGTSVISMYIAAGLVMSVHSHKEKQTHMFYTESYE